MAKSNDKPHKTGIANESYPADQIAAKRELIAQAFRAEQKGNDYNQYVGYCPVHGDSKPSLAIHFDNNGYVKLYCRSHKCKRDEIIKASGLEAGLFYESEETQTKDYTPLEKLKYGLEKSGDLTFIDSYDYVTETGKYIYTKIRCRENSSGRKVILSYTLSADGYAKGKPENVPHVLYNLPKMLEAKRNGKYIYFVEGEKDVATLAQYGLTATTCGSATEWKPEFAKYFTGAQLIILPDNDDPGRNLVKQVLKDIRPYAYSILIVPTSDKSGGDVTDYLEEGNSIEDLFQLIAAARDKGKTMYAPWLDMTKTGIKINCDNLAFQYGETQHYLISRNAIEEKDDLYIYGNGVYDRCNKSGFCSTIKNYIPQGMATAQAINNTYNLIVIGSKDEHVCTPADLNTESRYVNLRNGLYDIKTGKLIPHSPNIKSTIQLCCAYEPEAAAPVWSQFIREFCSDSDGNYNHEKAMVLQEFGGLIISNFDFSKLKKVLWLYSPRGDSGKSIFINTISYLLGGQEYKYSLNLPLQMMNENSKFAIGSLLGRRMISVGDQSTSEVKDLSLLKSLTGGDLVKVEQKGKQPVYIRFRGGIFVASNGLPSLTDRDKGEHIWKRFEIIPCEFHLDDSGKTGKIPDKELLSKIQEEMNGVFNWCLEGLHRIIANNYVLTKCGASETAVNMYRAESDTCYRFMIENGYEVTGKTSDKVVKKIFDDEYMQFCEDVGLTPLSKGNLKQRLLSIGVGYATKGRVDATHTNNPHYYGIRLNERQEDLDDLSGFDKVEIADTPFRDEPDRADIPDPVFD